MKILFQGDSITDCGRTGSGNPAESLGGGYPFLIAARLGAQAPEGKYNIINRGISGNRVVDLYARWKIDGVNLEPDLLSILVGVNDTWHEKGSRNGVEVPRYREFYQMLLEWMLRERPNCKLVLCEPFVLMTGAVDDISWIDEIDRRREVVRSLAKEFGAIFIPFQQILSDAAVKAGNPALILRDGVHPTLTGHQIMADAWLSAVRP